MVMGPTLVSDASGKMVGSGKVHAYVSFVQERFVGRLGLRLAWKHGDQSFERLDRRDASSPLNEAQALSVSSDEPRLSQQLGKVSGVSVDSLPAGADAKDDGRFGWRGFVVGRVLDHVHTYLRWGLGSYWHGFGGRCVLDGVPMCELPDSKLDALAGQDLEECWAQHVTEALTLCSYEGPGSFMGAKPDTSLAKVHYVHQQDATIFRTMRAKLGTDAAFYPIVFACQQLVSAAVFYRGFFEVADNPFDAVMGAATGNVPGAERKSNQALAVNIANLKASGWVKPGVALFRGHSDGKPIRHVGVLLRVDKLPDEHGKGQLTKFQLLDTGGWTSNSFGGGGSFDSAFLKDIGYTINAGLTPPTNEGKLREGIRAIRRARPLGAAQLVILRRGSAPAENRIYWASPMLHMHEGSGASRVAYPLTRLATSLRDIPYAKELDVRWRVYIPQLKSLEPAMEGVVPWWRPAGAAPKGVVEFGSHDDGHVSALQRAKQDLKNNSHVIPTFQPLSARTDFDGVPALDQSSLRGKYPELADMTGVQIPEYFKGTP